MSKVHGLGKMPVRDFICQAMAMAPTYHDVLILNLERAARDMQKPRQWLLSRNLSHVQICADRQKTSKATTFSCRAHGLLFDDGKSEKDREQDMEQNISVHQPRPFDVG